MSAAGFRLLAGTITAVFGLSTAASGQTTAPGALLEVHVVSEFAVAPGGREILSPALVRNGWSRFHLLLTGPPGTRYRLDIAQNPDNAADVRFGRGTEPLELPLAAQLPDTGRELFRLEFWIAGDAPIRRVKLEPQVFTDASGWIVYPMEGRVVTARVPEGPPRSRSWREFLCRDHDVPPLDAVGQQEIRLAEAKPVSEVGNAFARALGRPVADWCRDGKSPAAAEWFLTFRDWLLK